MCVPKETKYINIKVFSNITNKTPKQWKKHISCDCKCKFNSTTCSSKQKWNNKTGQCECKCKKDYSWDPSTCICENNKYLKSTDDASVVECGEIILISYGYCINKNDKYHSNKCNKKLS